MGRGAGAAGVFPFGLGREAIEFSGARTEPFRVLVGGVLGHADRRETIYAHTEAHFYIGLGGPADGVYQFVFVWDLGALGGEHEEAVLVPGPPLRLRSEASQAHHGPQRVRLFGAE